jgi:hypothetical protein
MSWGPQTLYHKTFILSNPKPYIPEADDTTDIMVCQTLKPYKKIPRNQGEIVDNRNLFLTNLYSI